MESKKPTTYESKSTRSSQQVCEWTLEEQAQLIKKYAALLVVQRTYGQKYDIEATLKAWKYFLSKYSVEEIIFAMDKWVEISPDLPTPSDIIKIITPKKEAAKRLKQQEKLLEKIARK